MIDKDIRENVLKEISKYIPADINKDIEKGIYLFSDEYAESNGTPFLLEQIYTSKAEELIQIFKSKNLQFIITKLKNEEFKPEKIAFMTKEELIPDMLNKKNKEDDGGTRGLVDCPKCKKSNVKIREVQRRAADEPADIFATCLECGHVFMI
jgi:DNA-directed RNA polymerase subunit M/transcription elongation factor TFIIS